MGPNRPTGWSLLVVWKFLFQSDGSGASSGMHVDDFVMFAIEKVDEFTIDVDCDNPTGGYTTHQTTFSQCTVS
ncbi:MAG: hypothetical protein CM15mP71_1070 [Candidatus Poseidoniales archaeon]|nr:MAG: hypothetical protein CM15mP71_1070 [Candidatus Poseidoniales archaeon]